MEDNIENDFYKELLRSYVDSTNDVIFVLCDEMKFLLCNSAATNFFGKAEKELTKHGQRIPITEFLNDDKTIALFEEKFPQALNGKAVKFESKTKQLNQDKWIEFCLDRVNIEHAPMVIVVARDITHRKEYEIRLEEQVRERTKELEIEIKERKNAEQKALNATKAKSAFLASMNHELRNPLNAILGYAELTRGMVENGNNDFAQNLSAIEKSGNHMLSIISDILDFSKIESGKLELNIENDSLKDCIDDAMITAKPMKDMNSNTLELQYLTEIDAAKFDRLRVTQVLLNLLSNACKFTNNGTITLCVTTNDSSIIVKIQDTGIGMNESELQKVFSEYEQANNSTTKKYGGTGLGIPISQKLCTLMGGNLLATSTFGEGSCFEMSFTYQ